MKTVCWLPQTTTSEPEKESPSKPSALRASLLKRTRGGQLAYCSASKPADWPWAKAPHLLHTGI